MERHWVSAFLLVSASLTCTPKHDRSLFCLRPETMCARAASLSCSARRGSAGRFGSVPRLPRLARIVFLAMMVGPTKAQYCTAQDPQNPQGQGTYSNFCRVAESIMYPGGSIPPAWYEYRCAQQRRCMGENTAISFLNPCNAYPSCIASIVQMTPTGCGAVLLFPCMQCCYDNPAPPPNFLPRPPPRPPPAPPMRCLPRNDVSSPECSTSPSFSNNIQRIIISGTIYPPGTYYCCGSPGLGTYCRAALDCPRSSPPPPRSSPPPSPPSPPPPQRSPPGSSSLCQAPVGSYCCYDDPARPNYACSAGFSCGRGRCVPAGSVLCGCSGQTYCPAGSTCCGSTCCPIGQWCGGDANSCACSSNAFPQPRDDLHCGSTPADVLVAASSPGYVPGAGSCGSSASLSSVLPSDNSTIIGVSVVCVILALGLLAGLGVLAWNRRRAGGGRAIITQGLEVTSVAKAAFPATAMNSVPATTPVFGVNGKPVDDKI